MAQPWEANFVNQEDDFPFDPTIFDQPQPQVQQPVQQQPVAQPVQQPALATSVQPSTAVQFGQQGFSGFNEGLANVIGAPVDIMAGALNLGARGVNRLAGTNIPTVDDPFLGSESVKGFLTGAGTIAPESADPSLRFTRRVGREIGAASIPGSVAIRLASRPLRAAGALATSAAGSAGGGEVAETLFPGNELASVGGELIGGGLTLGAIGARTRRRLGREMEAAVPSNVDLKTQATQKYDEAAAIGVSARNEDVKDFTSGIDDLLREEGVLLEAGDLTVNFPKISSLRKQLKNLSKGGDLSVPRMQTLRRSISRAAGSADGDEGRLGSIILDQFDDFVAPLAPPLAEARILYRRAKKSEQLDIIGEVAETAAGTSGGDIEKSLRSGFKSLDTAIKKGQKSGRGFRPEEAAAIERVSRGTRGGNIARGAGRFGGVGVRGVAATGLGSIIGSSAGPVGAGLGGAAVQSGAGAARRIARTSTLRNAELADILIRNVVPIDRGAVLTPELARLGASLLAGQGVNQFGDER